MTGMAISEANDVALLLRRLDGSSHYSGSLSDLAESAHAAALASTTERSDDEGQP